MCCGRRWRRSRKGRRPGTRSLPVDDAGQPAAVHEEVSPEEVAVRKSAWQVSHFGRKPLRDAHDRTAALFVADRSYEPRVVDRSAPLGASGT